MARANKNRQQKTGIGQPVAGPAPQASNIVQVSDAVGPNVSLDLGPTDATVIPMTTNDDLERQPIDDVSSASPHVADPVSVHRGKRPTKPAGNEVAYDFAIKALELKIKQLECQTQQNMVDCTRKMVLFQDQMLMLAGRLVNNQKTESSQWALPVPTTPPKKPRALTPEEEYNGADEREDGFEPLRALDVHLIRSSRQDRNARQVGTHSSGWTNSPSRGMRESPHRVIVEPTGNRGASRRRYHVGRVECDSPERSSDARQGSGRVRTNALDSQARHPSQELSGFDRRHTSNYRERRFKTRRRELDREPPLLDEDHNEPRRWWPDANFGLRPTSEAVVAQRPSSTANYEDRIDRIVDRAHREAQVASKIKESSKRAKPAKPGVYSGESKYEILEIWITENIRYFRCIGFLRDDHNEEQVYMLGVNLKGEASEWYTSEVELGPRPIGSWSPTKIYLGLKKRFVRTIGVEEAAALFETLEQGPRDVEQLYSELHKLARRRIVFTDEYTMRRRFFSALNPPLQRAVASVGYSTGAHSLEQLLKAATEQQDALSYATSNHYHSLPNSDRGFATRNYPKRDH